MVLLLLIFSLASSAVAGNAVSVLGSRFARNVDEQAVPVEVITELEIRAAGFTETNELLQSLVPSYNAPRGYITDGFRSHETCNFTWYGS